MTAMHVVNTLSARSLSPATSLNPSTNAIILRHLTEQTKIETQASGLLKYHRRFFSLRKEETKFPSIANWNTLD